MGNSAAQAFKSRALALAWEIRNAWISSGVNPSRQRKNQATEIMPVFIPPKGRAVKRTIAGLDPPGDLEVYRHYHMILLPVRRNPDIPFIAALIIQGGPEDIVKVDGQGHNNLLLVAGYRLLVINPSNQSLFGLMTVLQVFTTPGECRDLSFLDPLQISCLYQQPATVFHPPKAGWINSSTSPSLRTVVS